MLTTRPRRQLWHMRTRGRRRHLNTPTQTPCSRAFSVSGRRGGYEDTIGNLKIGRDTRVVFQGFTGMNGVCDVCVVDLILILCLCAKATANAKESIAWGTNIVGGVTPGKNTEHLGLPVLPSVREAMQKLKPHATGIYVAAHQAPAAIEEAIEAEVPLIVAVAEHIPVHDLLRIHSMLHTQSKSRLVGANSPGIISAVGRCRIGFQPLPCFMPGRVGIVAKSGTLSYEAVASTTRAGLGQSLCIGMGGDVLAGTRFIDALKIFEHDDDTEGIVLIGEIGGMPRWRLLIGSWSTRSVLQIPSKPIAAVIGGVNAAPGRVMGHAGAFILPGEPDALAKVKRLQDAGVTIVNHPAKFGEAMKTLLGSSGRVSSGAATTGTSQRRGMHTMRRRPKVQSPVSNFAAQKRNLYIRENLAFDLLRERGINASEYSGKGRKRMLAVGIDRANMSPCIIASPATNNQEPHVEAKKFPFDYVKGFVPSQIPVIAEHLQLGGPAKESLAKLINSLVGLYMQKEAFLLETSFVERLGDLKVVGAHFGFDDAAFRSTKRQGDIHALRRIEDEDAQEVEAEKDGIVYIKLAGDGNIGTLVNGAGLAMNTIDALADVGGKAANFLDTGGKATSETVKKSFQVILQDERVKVIFVNIFGGLTLGDMIANGVLLAFKELEMRLPVVVRIRGTNEAEGQKIIAESGLPLHAFDDFEEAAAKAIELAG
ncbi:Succinate--CoA ligase [ADP-forming] subunit alpha-1, mitochondrial [Lachnellula subtilissima]|uniref:Succinate--CoA ligase [ADP-forming] subunit alpha-1, mitochondrial n=1 Tax=Lachnellula subtilissima TaxID=602034 RepID=A0A8H8RYH0_9HELO|nr:Succinate--CoA ligase [ADP-forming] subunit alpha-1, mitochondrial [Lachnellula subtilissima]